MIVKIYDANKIPDLSDDGILDYLSYQPKSDYRTPIKVERLTDHYAVRVSFSETVDANTKPRRAKASSSHPQKVKGKDNGNSNS